MSRIISFCLLYSALFLSCNKTPEVGRTVEYSIACADCEVIYNISGGQQATEHHKNSDWTFSFSGKSGEIVLLFAYNTSTTPQGVTARIRLNDEILKEETRYCAISGYSFVVDTL
ncbi:MAG: hypothetical protein SH857_16340 [Chitinophagales bacterium]|nr:hypothetical protein [Chitinophagales bacterium]